MTFLIQLLLAVATVQFASAAICGGGTGRVRSYQDGRVQGSSQLIWDTTKSATGYGNEDLTCQINYCNGYKLTIDRIELSSNGEIQCVLGGASDTKFRMKLFGGNDRTITGKIWATLGEKLNLPLGNRSFPCYTKSVSPEC